MENIKKEQQQQQEEEAKNSLLNHLTIMIDAANKAGIKTYVVSNIEELYDTKCDFLDIK